MKQLIISFTLCASLFATAQPKNAASKYAGTITAADLKEKLTVIAGAPMEGRETATAGQRKAALYIESYFKKLKLQPGTSTGYQMMFPVYQDSLETVSLTINDTSFTLNKDFTVSASSITTGEWSANNIIFASYGLADTSSNNYDGLDVKNKWVMVLEGMPALTNKKEETNNYAPYIVTYAKIAEAKMRGVKGIIIVTKDFSTSSSSLKGNMYNKTSAATEMPVIKVPYTTAAAILKKPVNSFEELKYFIRGVYDTHLQLKAKKKTLNLQSSNILAVLPGTTKKDEYIFITGHYDHLGKKDSVIYYGADDDGSGTTSVLQIAEAFAKAKANGKGPARSIVFMTVSGEEEGLWGSDYYTSHPVFPLNRVSVDLNIDMVGRIDPAYKGDSNNYVYVIGEDNLSSDLRKISDSINRQYMHMQLDRRYNDPKDPNRFYYRSDHYNFAKKGVPVLFYFNGVHADYHKPTDTVDKINFNVMEKRVKLIFYTAWAMANREKILQRDKPLP